MYFFLDCLFFVHQRACRSISEREGRMCVRARARACVCVCVRACASSCKCLSVYVCARLAQLSPSRTGPGFSSGLFEGWTLAV